MLPAKGARVVIGVAVFEMSVQGGGGGEGADLGVLPADLPLRYVLADRAAAKRRWADKGGKVGGKVAS